MVDIVEGRRKKTKIPIRLILFFLIVAGLVVGIYLLVSTRAQAGTEEVEFVEEVPASLERREFYEVQDGDTFTTVMEALGLGYQEALDIVAAAEEVFDFTNVKLGKSFALVSEHGTHTRIEYEPNSNTVITVDLLNGAYETLEQPIDYDIIIDSAEVTIQDSMFLSGIDAGLPEVLIVKLADVLAWEIDFATQVQTGDSFRVLYERRFRYGEESTVGDVLATGFVNTGEESLAYRFVDGEGDIGYYNENGASMVREFLKAPLSYSRISSGFTYSRFHPTLQRSTPHRAIDYAAASGTPILAVADGTVTFSGYNGGFGNYIDIRHNSIYETQYAHLSRYGAGIHSGAHVKQGQVIGYVGSTGFSTGPHLHYQVEVSGTLVNPLQVEFPAGDPLAEDQLPGFFEQRDAFDAQF